MRPVIHMLVISTLDYGQDSGTACVEEIHEAGRLLILITLE